MAILFYVAGVLTLVGSGIFLVAGGGSNAAMGARLPLAVAGALSALLFFGIGNGLDTLEGIHREVQRSADALQRLTQRRPPQK